MAQTIFITGATGTVGPSVVNALDKTGARIRTFSFDAPTPGLFSSHIDNVIGDVTDQAAVQSAMQGVDAVVHLAARNHVLKETAKNPLAEYRCVNVEGTRNVVLAAAKSGARLFIHLSSVKAMGEESEEILNEECPCAPKTPYGISKMESEKAVRAEVAKNRMGAVILRLPMVYGPRNKGNLQRMIRWAERGLPFPLFQPDNLRSMVYVENVVAGIMAVLNNPSAGMSTYILKDREDYSSGTVYSAICRELGKKPRFLRVPTAITKLGGILSEDFRKVTGSFRVSSAKIERETGFIPPVSFEEGISRTIRWYRDASC
jgi:nucleoside-diphosphate-sugar epimerase